MTFDEFYKAYTRNLVSFENFNGFDGNYETYENAQRELFDLALAEERKKTIEEFKDLGKLYSEIRAEERQKVIDKFTDLLPKSFCQYCPYCEGGTVESIQECETIRMLKDAIEEVVDELKEA